MDLAVWAVLRTRATGRSTQAPGTAQAQTGSPSNLSGVHEPDALSILDEISASVLIHDLEGMRE
jgi:hypothetical protein